VRGANYGWPLVSNGDHYDGRPIPGHATGPEFAAPKVTWTPVISPAGF
jgi:glucose/arabinose dehydrogenase